jgi:cytochrome P450
MILPSFTKKNLKYNKDIYTIGSQNLVDMFKDKISQGKSNVFDLYHYFECSALDVITKLSIGHSLNTVRDETMSKEFFKVWTHTQYVLFLKGLIPSISTINVPTVERYKYLIEQSVKYRQCESVQFDDTLQSLMDGQDPQTGENLTLTEIIEEFFIILYAGLDTTSNTMTWTLYEILKNPELYDLIKQEILDNFPDLTKPMNLSDCEAKLVHLEAVIWESLRMHSVVETFARRVPEGGVTIADHYLPEKVLLLIYLMIFLLIFFRLLSC